jgi:hypothetical protein
MYVRAPPLARSLSLAYRGPYNCQVLQIRLDSHYEAINLDR